MTAPDEHAWFEMSMRLVENSRRLLAEAESTLRWFRSTGGPLWHLVELGQFNDFAGEVSFRMAMARVDAGTDPVTLFEASCSGQTLRHAVRTVRRYRALARAVEQARAAHGRMGTAPLPARRGETG